MDATWTGEDGSTVAGRGTYSHAVPSKNGRVVEILDSHHEGTGVYWSESRGAYAFARYDCGVVQMADRCLLVRGQNVEETAEPYGCDLDTPDGLVLMGCDLDADLSEILSDGAEVLWDSAG